MPQMPGAGPAASTESSKHITVAQQTQRVHTWPGALSIWEGQHSTGTPCKHFPQHQPKGKGRQHGP